MSYTKKSIKIEDLLVNPKNFRFDPVANQKAAINTMINKMKEKVKKQAEDIAKRGLNPTESLSVTKTYKRKYIVHEGNRRLTAVKLIDNPRIIPLDKKTKDFFQKLKTDYGHNLPSEIDCVIFSQEKDTYHWTRLKHTGENRGIGVVPWNNKQQGRFEANITDSKPKKHIQVQHFMEKNSISFPDNHSTTLERLISNPSVRDRIGIDFKDGDLKYKNEQTAVYNLNRISVAMSKDDFNVRKLDSVEDRKKWIKKVLADEHKSPEFVNRSKERGTEKRIKIRATLIPKDLTINIDQERVKRIYEELQNLKIDEYNNATAVLFRVFLELSIMRFIEKKEEEGTDLLKGLKKKGKDQSGRITLRQKMKVSCDYMKKNQILKKDELQPVFRAIEKEHDISSIQTFNSYVHSLSNIPLGKDLQRSWDSMQKFMKKLWE